MSDDTPHILCSECGEPVYYDSSGEHACMGCDDSPDGWRMLSMEEILNNASEYQ